MKKRKMTPAQIAAQKRATEARIRQRKERESKGIFRPVYTRLSLTDEALAITKDMDNKEFREFVSAAILAEAKAKGIPVT